MRKYITLLDEQTLKQRITLHRKVNNCEPSDNFVEEWKTLLKKGKNIWVYKSKIN